MVIEKLTFPGERSTNYVNSSGVMFLNIKDCEKQEMLQSSSLCNSNWNSGEKNQNSNFPTLTYTLNSTRSNSAVQF